MLLILIQLPKKEAGLGTAFGSGATDALFGAGSGTALTKITKYSAGIFLGLSMTLSVLHANRTGQVSRALSPEELSKRATTTVVVPAPVATNLVTLPTPAIPNTLLATNPGAALSPAATNPPGAPTP
jgi:preprotein translocase subunit SecG